MAGQQITVAGIGLRASATKDSLEAALQLADPEGTADMLVVLADKADLLSALTDRPVKALPMPVIRGIETLTQSARIREKFGTGSVCEALALVAAGRDALLNGPRIISPDGLVTAALATGGGTT